MSDIFTFLNQVYGQERRRGPARLACSQPVDMARLARIDEADSISGSCTLRKVCPAVDIVQDHDYTVGWVMNWDSARGRCTCSACSTGGAGREMLLAAHFRNPGCAAGEVGRPHR